MSNPTPNQLNEKHVKTLIKMVDDGVHDAYTRDEVIVILETLLNPMTLFGERQ